MSAPLFQFADVDSSLSFHVSKVLEHLQYHEEENLRGLEGQSQQLQTGIYNDRSKYMYIKGGHCCGESFITAVAGFPGHLVITFQLSLKRHILLVFDKVILTSNHDESRFDSFIEELLQSKLQSKDNEISRQSIQVPGYLAFFSSSSFDTVSFLTSGPITPASVSLRLCAISRDGHLWLWAWKELDQCWWSVCDRLALPSPFIDDIISTMSSIERHFVSPAVFHYDNFATCFVSWVELSIDSSEIALCTSEINGIFEFDIDMDDSDSKSRRSAGITFSRFSWFNGFSISSYEHNRSCHLLSAQHGTFLAFHHDLFYCNLNMSNPDIPICPRSLKISKRFTNFGLSSCLFALHPTTCHLYVLVPNKLEYSASLFMIKEVLKICDGFSFIEIESIELCSFRIPNSFSFSRFGLGLLVVFHNTAGWLCGNRAIFFSVPYGDILQDLSLPATFLAQQQAQQQFEFDTGLGVTGLGSWSPGYGRIGVWNKQGLWIIKSKPITSQLSLLSSEFAAADICLPWGPSLSRWRVKYVLDGAISASTTTTKECTKKPPYWINILLSCMQTPSIAIILLSSYCGTEHIRLGIMQQFLNLCKPLYTPNEISNTQAFGCISVLTMLLIPIIQKRLSILSNLVETSSSSLSMSSRSIVDSPSHPSSSSVTNLLPFTVPISAAQLALGITNINTHSSPIIFKSSVLQLLRWFSCSQPNTVLSLLKQSLGPLNLELPYPTMSSPQPSPWFMGNNENSVLPINLQPSDSIAPYFELLSRLYYQIHPTELPKLVRFFSATSDLDTGTRFYDRCLKCISAFDQQSPISMSTLQHQRLMAKCELLRDCRRLPDAIVLCLSRGLWNEAIHLFSSTTDPSTSLRNECAHHLLKYWLQESYERSAADEYGQYGYQLVEAENKEEDISRLKQIVELLSPLPSQHAFHSILHSISILCEPRQLAEQVSSCPTSSISSSSRLFLSNDENNDNSYPNLPTMIPIRRIELLYQYLSNQETVK